MFHNQLLFEIEQSGKRIYLERFDRERGVLIIGDREIILGKKAGVENNQSRLLATLIKDTTRFWATDELIEDWEGFDPEHDMSDIPKHRFYDAAQDLNTTVELATGITDFIDHTTKQVRINPLYLKEI